MAELVRVRVSVRAEFVSVRVKVRVSVKSRPSECHLG